MSWWRQTIPKMELVRCSGARTAELEGIGAVVKCKRIERSSLLPGVKRKDSIPVIDYMSRAKIRHADSLVFAAKAGAELPQPKVSGTSPFDAHLRLNRSG